MKAATLVLAASAGMIWSAATSDASAAPAQPPMGQFLGAYYTCDQGHAFQVSYNSTAPTVATVTTSNHNARYQLKRVDAGGGPQFSNGSVSVAVSGDTAQVQGTAISLTGCKLKNTT